MSFSEADAVRARYERRKQTVDPNRYSFLNASVWQGVQYRQRAMLKLFAGLGWRSFADVKLVEVGCGEGGNLLELLRIGFRPENLIGIELLADRTAIAARTLPAGIVRQGDATAADVPPGSQDVVFQSTVFSSLLDDAFQQRLAERMWSWLRPGGGVLWYDFTWNNPRNPDVRGVKVRRIRELFPEGECRVRRVTLAAPIARRVCRIRPELYALFHGIPWLRTHVLCWIQKPR